MLNDPSKAEEFLSILLWGAEKLILPTWKNLDRSFEDWDYEHRIRPQLHLLARRKLLQRPAGNKTKAYQLTERGRLAALGGRDPVSRWERAWDGKWRMVLFDIPRQRQATRVRLIRWLRQNYFGYLQNSIWIQPDPVTGLFESVHGLGQDVESFTIMEARCAAGYSNPAVVIGAWDFAEINERYQDYLDVATTELTMLKKRHGTAEPLFRWLHRERLTWLRATTIDPFLPDVLHPSGYLGRQAWQARQVALKAATLLVAGPR